jgi:hypothetical protein
MARELLLLAGMLLLGGAFAFNARAASPWEPLVPGDTVSFLIPEYLNTGVTDALIFGGGVVSEIDTTGCAAGLHPVQHHILVDFAGTRSERRGGIISLTSLPVQPSTRLLNPTFDSTCSIGDVLYYRYDGVVE